VPSDTRAAKPDRVNDAAHRRQARYWDRRYRSDPTLFGAEASPFLTWVLAALRNRSVGPTWVELGAGYGRDLLALRGHGYSVQGVDVSRVGSSLARRSGLKVAPEHALPFLGRLSAGSVAVVFSNLFYNMEFSEEGHQRLLAEVHRVLAPGGYHAYSVRSVSDRWYGRGRRVGPDIFDLSPDGPVLHFFSRAYAGRLRRNRFRCVRSWEGREEGGGFPVRVLYVLEQKPKERNVPP